MTNELQTAPTATEEIPVEKKEPLGYGFWIAIGWVSLIVLSAIFADFLPLADPRYNDYNAIQQGSSWQHWLGTDDLGRDILSRLVYGARVSLEVGVFASLLGFSVGGSLGMLTAYRRNGVSKAISLVMLTMLAFPAFLATIAILSFWQPTTSLLHVIVVVGVFSIPLVFRVTQAATLSAATKDFVLAAKVQGATDRRIVFRELLPNVAPTILSFFLFAIATIIGIEGALSFLGFSVQSSVGPSWGNMLNESRTYLETSPGLAIWTCINLSLFLVALNFIGERLRSYFDVTEVKL